LNTISRSESRRRITCGSHLLEVPRLDVDALTIFDVCETLKPIGPQAQLASLEVRMSATIPDKYTDLFKKKAFANLATINSDGTPQVTPVWVDYDGKHVIVNSARGRRKDKNMVANNAVALSIMDPDNPYRYLEIRGRVAEITEEGADQHIDKMAKKYMGVDKYPYRGPGEVRVIYRIEPRSTSAMG